MDRFTSPEPLPFEGNIGKQWRKWKQELTLYITAAEMDKKSDLVKSSILLTCINKRGPVKFITLSPLIMMMTT